MNWYRLDCSAANADADLHAHEARRAVAIDYVNHGMIQGYLAYEDGRVVGWCNANRKADCMDCVGWREEISSEPHDRGEAQKIKSVFCFTVDPDKRGQGIAEALLRQVIADAGEERYDLVEGYPNRGESDMYYDYVGPVKLYEKLGFSVTGETQRGYIVQKKL